MKPTQVARPWRATARTVFAVLVALATMLPAIVAASGVDQTLAPIAGALAIAAGVTRVLAIPAVDDFLVQFLPWLAADPPAKTPLTLLDNHKTVVDQVTPATELVASILCHVCNSVRFELPITTTLWGLVDVDDTGCISVTAPTGSDAGREYNAHMQQHLTDGTLVAKRLEHADQMADWAATIRALKSRE